MAVSDLYCSRADVNKRVPLGSIVSPASVVASALAGTDVITCDGHGFETGDLVNVRVAQNGTMPVPLSSSVTYYAIRMTNAAFKVSLTPNGAPIDITGDGDQVIVTREPDYDTTIEFYSRWADTFMPAHAVPFGVTEPVPALVRGLVADLAAKRILNADGKSSNAVNEFELAAMAQLTRFAAGLPVRGSPAPLATNRAVTSTLSTGTDARGWNGQNGSRLP